VVVTALVLSRPRCLDREVVCPHTPLSETLTTCFELARDQFDRLATTRRGHRPESFVSESRANDVTGVRWAVADV